MYLIFLFMYFTFYLFSIRAIFLIVNSFYIGCPRISGKFYLCILLFIYLVFVCRISYSSYIDPQ